MWVVMIYHDLSWLITAEGDIKALEKDFRAIRMRSCLGNGSIESQEKDA